MAPERKVWKVLFVDDEEGIRKVMAITLADAGYQVLTAPDGETALSLCAKESPQITITDIRMPGIDGIEVLRRIKEHDPNKEVIVVTAYGEIDIAIRALQLDASDFITKPIHTDALLIALDRAKERFTTRKELQDYTSILEERWMSTAEELARTFNFQKNLIDSSMDGILGCDKGGVVVTYNKSLERMLGYSKDEVVRTMPFSKLFATGEAERFSEACGGDCIFLNDCCSLRPWNRSHPHSSDPAFARPNAFSCRPATLPLPPLWGSCVPGSPCVRRWLL
jgi:CheY-like chemotaxis protein